MADLDFDLECPNCGRKMTVKVKDMYPGNFKVCTVCGFEIPFAGDDGRKAQRALNDFERKLKQLERKFKRARRR
jgi:rubredoxin